MKRCIAILTIASMVLCSIPAYAVIKEDENGFITQEGTIDEVSKEDREAFCNEVVNVLITGRTADENISKWFIGLFDQVENQIELSIDDTTTEDELEEYKQNNLYTTTSRYSTSGASVYKYCVDFNGKDKICIEYMGDVYNIHRDYYEPFYIKELAGHYSTSDLKLKSIVDNTNTFDAIYYTKDNKLLKINVGIDEKGQLFVASVAFGTLDEMDYNKAKEKEIQNKEDPFKTFNKEDNEDGKEKN